MHRLPLSILTIVSSAFITSAAVGEQQPLDAPNGPPFVTCKHWVVGDAETGKVLWGEQADTPAKAASTTKIMCAYVVLQLAAKDPRIMDELVTFSELADKTDGSTADIRAGERIKVSDCLYALLLPSGNDAGVALAEHFNERLEPRDGEKVRSTQSNFLAEMNRTAQRLELNSATYRSSFGDGGSADDRTISAADLIRLARTAMQNETFRTVVGTPRYECTLVDGDGKKREVAWENTNRLLGIAGYDGVKTGTTNLAGCCLVSSARYDGRHLMAVVLGSTSTDARFVDTRNLIRWARQELRGTPSLQP